MRRISSSLARASALALCFCAGRSFADVRAPETEGEKRLVEWDLTKKFQLKASSFSYGQAGALKTVSVSPFAARSFVTKTSADARSFYTPEFLTAESRAAQKSFTSKAAYVPSSGALTKGFTSGKAGYPSTPFASPENPAALQKAVADGERSYLGPEAERAKRVYKPENAPRGGVTTGHVLTVEEVRDILNRNK